MSAAGVATISAGVSTRFSQAQEGPATGAPRNDPGRVVKVVHSQCLSNPDNVDSQPETANVELMVDTALLAFTGRGEIGAAWREFIHPDDRVLIKLNCMGAPLMATNEATVYAIVRGLQTAGVNSSNMVIFDQFRSRLLSAHFRPGSDVLEVAVEYDQDRGYSTWPTEHGSGSSRFAVAFEWATAVVNVPVFKDHSVCGFSGSIKNISHGVIDNPSDMHSDGCNPAIADIYRLDLVQQRIRLVICDALRVMYDGGPQDGVGKTAGNSIYVATDPVAIDTVGFDLVQQIRDEQGLPLLEEDGRPCTWLQTAADYRLGVHNRDEIRLEEYVLA